jgi:YfiH family protein
MTETLVDGFHWSREPWGNALRCRSLGEIADHFFTSLPLRLRGPHGQEAAEWAHVAATIGVPAARLLRPHQVHGNRVVVGRRPGADADAAGARPEADVIVSDDAEVAVAVQVADCVPLLVADRRRGVVAAAHAGWRGTVANVAATTVAALAREFGSQPSDLVVAHGPSIGACCYVVGEDLLEAFRRGGHSAHLDRWFSRDDEGALRLDLWAANRDQLQAAGVPASQIHQSRLCTASRPDLFASYRRDGKGTGRVAAVIKVSPSTRAGS